MILWTSVWWLEMVEALRYILQFNRVLIIQSKVFMCLDWYNLFFVVALIVTLIAIEVEDVLSL